MAESVNEENFPSGVHTIGELKVYLENKKATTPGLRQAIEAEDDLAAEQARAESRPVPERSILPVFHQEEQLLLSFLNNRNALPNDLPIAFPTESAYQALRQKIGEGFTGRGGQSTIQQNAALVRFVLGQHGTGEQPVITRETVDTLLSAKLSEGEAPLDEGLQTLRTSSLDKAFEGFGPAGSAMSDSASIPATAEIKEPVRTLLPGESVNPDGPDSGAKFFDLRAARAKAAAKLNGTPDPVLSENSASPSGSILSERQVSNPGLEAGGDVALRPVPNGRTAPSATDLTVSNLSAQPAAPAGPTFRSLFEGENVKDARTMGELFDNLKAATRLQLAAKPYLVSLKQFLVDSEPGLGLLPDDLPVLFTSEAELKALGEAIGHLTTQIDNKEVDGQKIAADEAHGLKKAYLNHALLSYSPAARDSKIYQNSYERVVRAYQAAGLEIDTASMTFPELDEEAFVGVDDMLLAATPHVAERRVPTPRSPMDERISTIKTLGDFKQFLEQTPFEERQKIQYFDALRSRFVDDSGLTPGYFWNQMPEDFPIHFADMAALNGFGENLVALHVPTFGKDGTYSLQTNELIFRKCQEAFDRQTDDTHPDFIPEPVREDVRTRGESILSSLRAQEERWNTPRRRRLFDDDQSAPRDDLLEEPKAERTDNADADMPFSDQPWNAPVLTDEERRLTYYEARGALYSDEASGQVLADILQNSARAILRQTSGLTREVREKTAKKMELAIHEFCSDANRDKPGYNCPITRATFTRLVTSMAAEITSGNRVYPVHTARLMADHAVRLSEAMEDEGIPLLVVEHAPRSVARRAIAHGRRVSEQVGMRLGIKGTRNESSLEPLENESGGSGILGQGGITPGGRLVIDPDERLPGQSRFLIPDSPQGSTIDSSPQAGGAFNARDRVDASRSSTATGTSSSVSRSSSSYSSASRTTPEKEKMSFSKSTTLIGAAVAIVGGAWISMKSMFGGKDEKSGKDEGWTAGKVTASVLGLALLGGGAYYGHKAYSR